MYDEEDALLDNLCRDGTKYVDKDEAEREDMDVAPSDNSGEQEDGEDDWVDCDDDEEDDVED